MRAALNIILWVAVGLFGILAVLMMSGAGGNLNAKDPQGKPIIFGLWVTIYHPNNRAARLDLFLDRGADVNAALPNDYSYHAGYSITMERTGGGLGEAIDYPEALHLLQRGADFRYAAPDGVTLAKIVAEHRKFYIDEHKPPPPEYDALCNWLKNKDEALTE